MNPARGGGFNVFDNIREAMRRAKSGENMNVVINAADGFGNCIKSFNTTAEKCAEAARAIYR